MPNSNALTKTCTVCKNDLPATSEYFHSHKTGRDGLRPDCKTCVNQRNREWRDKNRDKVAEYNQEYRKEHLEERHEYDKQYYQDNKERIKLLNRKYYYKNHKERLTKKQEYRRTNPHKIKQSQKKWYAANRDRVAEWGKQYRSENKEVIQQRKRIYRRNHPEKHRRRIKKYSKTIKGRITKVVSVARRRARKLSLPNTFTSDDWRYCLSYFNYTCPVCDKQLRGLFGLTKPHADHWIPLAASDCPGTVKENMVCLCNHCNNSKGAKDPVEWLHQTFNGKKANAILDRIQDYFQSLD